MTANSLIGERVDGDDLMHLRRADRCSRGCQGRLNCCGYLRSDWASVLHLNSESEHSAGFCLNLFKEMIDQNLNTVNHSASITAHSRIEVFALTRVVVLVIIRVLVRILCRLQMRVFARVGLVLV